MNETGPAGGGGAPTVSALAGMTVRGQHALWLVSPIGASTVVEVGEGEWLEVLVRDEKVKPAPGGCLIWLETPFQHAHAAGEPVRIPGGEVQVSPFAAGNQ